MLDRRVPVLVVALVAVLAAAGPTVAVGSGAAGGLSADRPTERSVGQGQVVTVTTDEPLVLNATTVGFVGTYEGIAESRVVDAWFEYRPRTSTARNWTRTPAASVWAGGFGLNATGLSPGTTYEVRAVLETPNGTVRGDGVSFETPPGEPTPTPHGPDGAPGTPTPSQTSTPTPYRLSTTATPTDTPLPPPSPSPTSDGVAPPSATVTVAVGDSLDWLSGLVPLLAWIGGVAVLAPVVLGGVLVVRALGGDGG